MFKVGMRNKSLPMLKREQAGDFVESTPPKVPQLKVA
jgi:hypothetical protein